MATFFACGGMGLGSGTRASSRTRIPSGFSAVTRLQRSQSSTIERMTSYMPTTGAALPDGIRSKTDPGDRCVSRAA